jgi:hypothetical protein
VFSGILFAAVLALTACHTVTILYKLPLLNTYILSTSTPTPITAAATTTTTMRPIRIDICARISAYIARKRKAARNRRLAVLHPESPSPRANHPLDNPPALPLGAKEFLERHQPLYLHDRRRASPKVHLGILVPGKYEK